MRTPGRTPWTAITITSESIIGVVRPLVLASSSPRRAELLRAAGLPFVIRVAPIDETRRADEAPEAYVRRLALTKARAVDAVPGELVLGADTVVVAGAACLGKPADAADAAAMLRQLAGRSHEVLTGVALVRAGEPVAVEVAATRVSFAAMTDAEVDWYVATAEPYDKAGGYAVQGLASRFVTAIAGSYANVVGLPVELVCRLVAAAGEDLLDSR
jgi:septum formation protein